MFRMLLIVSMFAAITACTKGSSPICKGADLLAPPIAQSIASPQVLDCSGVDAITADVKALSAEYLKCEPGAESIVGDIVCPKIVAALKSKITGQIPAAWKCKGGALNDGADKVLAICKANL